MGNNGTENPSVLGSGLTSLQSDFQRTKKGNTASGMNESIESMESISGDEILQLAHLLFNKALIMIFYELEVCLLVCWGITSTCG